jgi:GDPmannose 4,6-dehydratase
MKKALITGITGQDGSYLIEHLLQLGYEVHGLVRRTSNDPMERIDSMRLGGKVILHEGNVRDLSTIRMAMEAAVPDEVYNLAAQSHVGTSFKCPDETWDINYYGVGRIVNEAMKVNSKVRIYQASTSEMFGTSKPPQNEETPFNPVSPYAEAKLKAHEEFIVGYREKYGLFVCSGILFNHESPRRGKQFVTRKITHSLAKVAHGLQSHFDLGNLDARRDWGFAGDYVKAMHLMLQQPAPEDFVIATGESHTVRDFVNAAAAGIGMDMAWEGEGINEVGKNAKTGQVIVRVSEQFYRPREVDFLQGDASKALAKLGWKPATTFDELVAMMSKADFAAYENTPRDSAVSA